MNDYVNVNKKVSGGVKGYFYRLKLNMFLRFNKNNNVPDSFIEPSLNIAQKLRLIIREFNYSIFRFVFGDERV